MTFFGAMKETFKSFGRLIKNSPKDAKSAAIFIKDTMEEAGKMAYKETNKKIHEVADKIHDATDKK
jgi:hypothetical protein